MFKILFTILFFYIAMSVGVNVLGAPPDHAKGKGKPDKVKPVKPPKKPKPPKPDPTPTTIDDGFLTWTSEGDIGGFFRCSSGPCAYTPMEPSGLIGRGAGDEYDAFLIAQLNDDWSSLGEETVALNCGDIFPPTDINPVSGEPFGHIESCSRTVGLVEHDDGSCVAMLNVQNYYDLANYPMGYAWATSPDCRVWDYHRLIDIEGVEAPRYRGSSNALVYGDGTYYYPTDASPATGLGLLYGSQEAGWQWLRDDAGQAVTIAGESRVFPTAALDPDGNMHIIASRPVPDGWVAETLEHHMCEFTAAGINCCMKTDDSGTWTGLAKGTNLAITDTEFLAITYGELIVAPYGGPYSCP